MALRFQKHYTREEARELLPKIRQWLQQINHLRKKLDKFSQRLAGMATEGQDLGGETVNESIRTATEIRELLLEFQRREIMIKDLERGLIDFPSLIGGREVFLCWEQDEEDIEFWHEIDSGYAGRERL
ncbi:MAG: DUF2203 domain-containing protein [Verrucomicrobia bacterium]|nr:DUF2203 domain-containing protein [Verrucomicrobiota bacterium]